MVKGVTKGSQVLSRGPRVVKEGQGARLDSSCLPSDQVSGRRVIFDIKWLTWGNFIWGVVGFGQSQVCALSLGIAGRL